MIVSSDIFSLFKELYGEIDSQHQLYVLVEEKQIVRVVLPKEWYRPSKKWHVVSWDLIDA